MATAYMRFLRDALDQLGMDTLSALSENTGYGLSTIGDFFDKPLSTERVIVTLRNGLKQSELVAENRDL